MLLGAVVVAAFPGLGVGAGSVAVGSDRPIVTARPARTPDPTDAPTARPAVTPAAPTARPTPRPTKPPLPAADLCEPIFGFACGQDAGRYGPSRFKPAVTFALGDGWSTELHARDRTTVVRDEGRLTLLGDVTRTYPKGEEEEAKGSLRKIIGRIASTDGAVASKVRGLTIDGRKGYSVDLTAKGGEAIPVLGVGEETYFLQPFATTRIVLLDAGARTLALIIEPAGGASLRDLLATADDVAGSLRFR